MFSKPITISLSPNTESDDVWLALKILFSPQIWKEGSAIEDVEQWFCRYFSVDSAVSFNSGRSALLVILKAFGIGEGDEVLVQAFTCVAVPNSVLWVGARPIYVDIDDTFNMDPKEVEKKITKKTRAMIVQHTFGIPAQIDQLVQLAKKYHLILIEDCAHALGTTYKGKKVGTLGDAAFFSFGRDKVVSSIFGGMAIINDKWKMENGKLKQYQKSLPYPSYFWIFQQLFHPIAFSIILASYNWAPLLRRFINHRKMETVTVGKVLLFLLQKLHLLSFPVYPEEKKGKRPNDFPAKFPHALAMLLVNQLKKLERYNENRKQVADYYRDQMSQKSDFKFTPEVGGAIYLRFPFLFSKSPQLIKKVRQQGIYLGNWYHNSIDPTGVDFDAIGYQPDTCPKAKQAAQYIVNLPTRISLHDAKKVVEAINL